MDKKRRLGTIVTVALILMSWIPILGSQRNGDSIDLKQDNIMAAKGLLNWNKKNVVSAADLRKEEIGEFFAPEFVVKANGRSHSANYDNYFEFLNQFRKTIGSIAYDVEEFISCDDKVIIPMSATIHRTDAEVQIFDAILILGFDQKGKITLWQEVYVMRESHE